MASSRSNELVPSQEGASLPLQQYTQGSPGQLESRAFMAEQFQQRARSSHTTRSIQSGSPPARPNSQHSLARPEPKVDLRALEYVSNYDSQLMCPICHIPFIDPVMLDCEHHFCRSCFSEYWDSMPQASPPKCPSCRSRIKTRARKASRLIINMCDDIKVRCPNNDCTRAIARGYVNRHASTDCEERILQCPAFPTCELLTKRKHLVKDKCWHATHYACDCGRLIYLVDSLQHQTEECPKAGITCEDCAGWIQMTDLVLGRGHICQDTRQKCPGEDFGCSEFLEREDMDLHVRQCAVAKLASHLNAQADILTDLQSQLAWSKSRNEVLEAGLDILSDVLCDGVMHGAVSDFGRTETTRLQDSHWPAHRSTNEHDTALNVNHSSNGAVPTGPTSQQHLLALHESLRTDVARLEAEINAASAKIADQDARNSMLILNDTLRIKEELAITNANLFSTRAQVQWLLNRERAGQQQIGTRGRASPAAVPASRGSTSPNAGSGMAEPSENAAAMGQGFTPATVAAAAGRETPHGMMATAAGASLSRPVRRPSGGSQERVKL